MADHVPIPDSGGGTGSSTARFGEGLGHIFAMPANQVDTSARRILGSTRFFRNQGHVGDQGRVARDRDHRPVRRCPALVHLLRLRREDLFRKVNQLGLSQDSEEDLVQGTISGLVSGNLERNSRGAFNPTTSQGMHSHIPTMRDSPSWSPRTRTEVSTLRLGLTLRSLLQLGWTLLRSLRRGWIHPRGLYNTEVRTPVAGRAPTIADSRM